MGHHLEFIKDRHYSKTQNQDKQKLTSVGEDMEKLLTLVRGWRDYKTIQLLWRVIKQFWKKWLGWAFCLAVNRTTSHNKVTRFNSCLQFLLLVSWQHRPWKTAVMVQIKEFLPLTQDTWILFLVARISPGWVSSGHCGHLYSELANYSFLSPCALLSQKLKSI